MLAMEARMMFWSKKSIPVSFTIGENWGLYRYIQIVSAITPGIAYGRK